MTDLVKIGIIICNRYRTCAGGKCFRSLGARVGAFRLYQGRDVALVGYTTCDGCPGGNVEHAPEEMIKNGAEVVHLATGLVVGYPPCPYLDNFCEFIHSQYGLTVVIGTHPIPQRYFLAHQALGTWNSPEWQKRIKYIVEDEATRLRYD